MNKTEMLERINKAAEARELEAIRIATAQQDRFNAKVKAIKALAPRIKDMLDIAQHLYRKGIPIGHKRTLHCMSHSDEFVSSWWYHNLGFCYDRSQKPYEEYPIWVGFINGGACGEDLCVDKDGNIVKGRSKEMDMQRMLEHFDDFERKFYVYVESL